MKRAVEFVTRYVLSQWQMLAILPWLYGIGPVFNLAEGLWHGSKLSGYYMDPGGADGSTGTLISMWSAFLQVCVCAGLTGALLAVGLWHRRVARAV